MMQCSVLFNPFNRKINAKKGSSLLDAAAKASLPVNSICGGEGLCGRCKMIVSSGRVSAEITGKLTMEEMDRGYVLACMTSVESDLIIDIPDETVRKEAPDEPGSYASAGLNDELFSEEFKLSPLVRKIYLELDKPDLENNTADHQRVKEGIVKRLKISSVQLGHRIIQSLPSLLRENNFCITATVGLRKDIYEVMNIEGGNKTGNNYNVIIDLGTTTIIANLIDADNFTVIDSKACFNSQEIYGVEVTRRIIAAEKDGIDKLQDLLIGDINRLIQALAEENKIKQDDITAVICAGNTIMGHFLLALPVENIRRNPYTAVSVEPPPLRAVSAGIKINSRGLLYSLPGISGWIGSDITAGILYTGINRKKETSLFVDIGTNGEVVLGNREWLIACSASAGPALEGASVDCGMRAEEGAIDRVYTENNMIMFATIGDAPCSGICGSGIIDFVSVLLREKVINRSGKFIREMRQVVSGEGGKDICLRVDMRLKVVGISTYLNQTLKRLLQQRLQYLPL